MSQDERTSIWDDEDELRRMILEAEDNEIWRIEESDGDGDGEDAQAPHSDLLKLRMKLDSGAAAADGSGEDK